MSLNKGIIHKKEHRKSYMGAKAYDVMCRNHGSCTICMENRLHKFRDKKPFIDGEDTEWLCRQSIKESGE